MIVKDLQHLLRFRVEQCKIEIARKKYCFIKLVARAHTPKKGG